MILAGLFLAAAAQAAPSEVPKAASSPAEPIRVIVLDVTPGALSQDTARAASDLLAVALGEYPGLEVSSGEDVRRAMELEGEKAAIGCNDEGCLAEIAGALGAELAVFGRGAKLGEVKIITYSLFNSVEGKTVSRATLEFTDPSELLEKTGPTVRKLMASELERRGLLASGGAPQTAGDAAGEQAGEGSEEASDREEAGPSGGAETDEAGVVTWPGWTMLGVGAPILALGALTSTGLSGFGWLLWAAYQSTLFSYEADYEAAAPGTSARASLLGAAKSDYEDWPYIAWIFNISLMVTTGVFLVGSGLVAAGATWLLLPGEEAE